MQTGKTQEYDMKRFALYLGLATALMSSCSIKEEDVKTPPQDDVIFYASFEQPVEKGTRVYANEDLLLRNGRGQSERRKPDGDQAQDQERSQHDRHRAFPPDRLGCEVFRCAAEDKEDQHERPPRSPLGKEIKHPAEKREQIHREKDQ